MRVSFSSMTTARAAVNVLEAYGYSAKQIGRDVVTDCPRLLAVPAMQRRVGLAAIERVDLTGGSAPLAPDPVGSSSEGIFAAMDGAFRAGPTDQMRA